jgi:hypothetical protein
MQVIGDSYSSLSSVQCSTASSCVAVGSTVTNGGSAPLAERWNGTSWSLQSTVAPPNTNGSPVNYGVLNGVACPSASRCIAVGSHGEDLEFASNVLAELWNGTSWSLQSIQEPASISLFTSVACPSTTRCFAVGGMRPNASAPVRLLIEQWNGATWSKMTVPSSSQYYSSRLESVACVSATNCTAVGGAANTKFQTLIEHWNGSTWSVQTSPPQPSASSMQLNGVTCTSASNCIAVGGVVRSDGYYTPLFEHGNGTTWSLQPATAGVTVFPALASVACASPSDCNAVGDGYGPANIAHWNGSQWAFQAVPLPAQLTEAELAGVACALGRCTAVGFADGKATQKQHVAYIVRSS